jgi:4-diphosphocytidyl-2-C-methyl-D-erythritol kinase
VSRPEEGPGRGAGGDEGVWRDRAPAKVNLSLRVLAREEGGYHQIETVFQSLELADRVSVALRREPGVRLTVGGVAPGALGPERENLAVRAARAYLEALDPEGWEEVGVRLHLEKRIPHGAGLGGGSSDAAAVLRGLDALHDRALGLSRLVQLGATLGADVAFFVLDTARALGWGRGDRLLPLPALPPREVVLAIPPEGVATPWAYRLLAEHRRREARESAGGGVVSLEDLEDWDAVAAGAANAFQEVLEPVRPELARLRRLLQGAGAAPALLTGSGSAVFGVFSEAAAAEAAAAEVEEEEPTSRVIRTRTVG